MKKLLTPLITVILTIFCFSSIEAQIPIGYDLDLHLLNWIKSNVSQSTHLPLSFYIPPQAKKQIYQQMDSSGQINGAIERTITKEGLDIYDGAVYQIVLTMAGGSQDLQQAFVPLDYYWRGSIGKLGSDIRSGYPINLFVYDTKHPEAVSSDNNSFGRRGFIFRIIDANGEFLVNDPKDGSKTMAGFPQEDRLHWVDWKPVAGENAWVVMASMQLYYKKYCDPSKDTCNYDTNSVEIRLSEELARAAMMLQSQCGGIRMAPLGTYMALSKKDKRNFTNNNWWYEHISTENNISWYAALRMLYQITGKTEYKQAMDGIEKYMHFVWDTKERIFQQGAYEINGQWVISREHFALDVQTWGLDCFGPQKLDAWFGQGASFHMWQAAKKHAGFFDAQDQITGVGFTDEHDRISVEWTAGAIIALEGLGEYYMKTNPVWGQEASNDKMTMRRSMEKLRYKISDTQEAYSYSSRRGWVPFGWNSHDPRVMSMASTGWMIFVDAGVNPFWFIH